MTVLTAFYNDRVTYWGRGAPDGFGGYTYDAPISFNARWEDRTELATDADGNDFISRSRVYVPQAVDVDGYLYLGEITTADPRTVDGAHRIRDSRRIPDLFGDDAERRALL